ncbi:signal peptidase I [Lysinibacillus alkalisoli]|uniref:Signal peptidase I n=1 Tax=Lysinibacillus alkalisoli TaxID=1911548 RepID=A0A917FZN8_9BACI|nr:signal peptidase I [Lysinibacillus alkalisoli]GGG15343.1 signal peptidase I [Lysinibacillus alkalisoli]
MEHQAPAKNEFFSMLKTVIITFIVVLLIKTFILTPVNVKGVSMEPTYVNKDVVLVDRVTSLERFQQVVFESPNNPDEWYIKRLIGLPGDKIEMKNDVLYVNDKPYEENYVKRSAKGINLRTTEDFEAIIVPKDKLFVMGDNRLNSMDSRHFGFIEKDIIMGKVLATVYPFTNIGLAKKQ